VGLRVCQGFKLSALLLEQQEELQKGLMQQRCKFITMRRRNIIRVEHFFFPPRILLGESVFFFTSVPAIPIANPISASCSAGASLVPSPVAATTSPISLRSFTNISLSEGADLAITCRVEQTTRKKIHTKSITLAYTVKTHTPKTLILETKGEEKKTILKEKPGASSSL
jgi:hypothetical protein